MARQLVHHEGQGRGRGVVAGEHQRHHLVADLAVGEAPRPASPRAPTSRLSMSWRPESGSARRRAISPKTISSSTCARGEHLAPGRAGPAQQAPLEVDPVVAERALEVLGRGGALAGLVGIEAEQRAHRDPHRQVAHPVVDVDDLARPQPRDRRLGLGRHRLDRGGDLFAVKGGHHDRPGAVVVVVVDRQQAVAEQRDQVAEARLAPVEVLRMGDGDEVVGLRAEHEDDPASAAAAC